MWLHAPSPYSVWAFKRNLGSHMNSSGSNSLRPQSPKWPTQLCSPHIVDFYGSAGQFLTKAAEIESEVQELFFVCETNAARVSQYRGDLWMGFIDLNRCGRTTKYRRLVEWSCKWMVGRKGSVAENKNHLQSLARGRSKQSNSDSAVFAHYRWEQGTLTVNWLSWPEWNRTSGYPSTFGSNTQKKFWTSEAPFNEVQR